ncbi:MAG: hypothetical protein KF752_06680 [Pirellulaceae bacterium]|nr:hypothetical protein [Pirellulaceae bacterium]
MKGLPLVLLFTAMTFVAWGAYGPTLHHGSEGLQHDSLRAFVGVGLAYFLVAVIIPLGILRMGAEPGRWTVGGGLFSLVAGAVGALGALGIILALGYGGETVFVMPVVFGFAPVVNTLVSTLLGGTFKQIRPVFLMGILAVALGAVGVLTFRAPAASAAAKQTTTDQETPVPETADTQSDSPTSDDGSNEKSNPRDLPRIIMSIIMAAVCWGSYGPMLHLGQAKMSGSRLRPFICVGIAYFLIAVIAPMVLIYGRAADTGSWTMLGMSWSVLAGIAGAVGALGVILAFNAGGKPHYVMPLVFGFAPVVNTFISLSEKGTWHLVQPLFWACLAIVIAGAVTVLMTAPKPLPKPTH